MNNELLLNESIEEYHANEAISSTQLRTYIKSKNQFVEDILNPRDEKSESMVTGSALHTMVLEPEKFNNEFAVAPELNRRTNAGKEAWAKFLEDNKDKEVLTYTQADEASKMTRSILENTLATDLLKDALIEKSARVNLSNGLKIQCRPDAMKRDCIIDIKSCREIAGFNWDINNHGYSIQAGFYYYILSNIMPEEYENACFYFIAVDKTRTNDCKVFGLGNDQLRLIVENIIKPKLNSLGEFLEETGDLSKYVPTQKDVEWLRLL